MLLLIDTAAEKAIVALANKGKVIAFAENTRQREHASFLQPAIAEMLNEKNITVKQLAGVLVTEGPGSYTGIRVGMASAKGLCMAANIPLMVVNRLYIMALASKLIFPQEKAYYIPMIDARRMEVFYAVYNSIPQELKRPENLILTTDSFADELKNNKVIFTGSGCLKFNEIVQHKNLIVIPEPNLSNAMAITAQEMMEEKKWSNLVDAQPFYAKNFYNG